MHLTSTPAAVCEAKCILYSQNWQKMKKQSVGCHTGDPGEPIMQFPTKGQQVGAQGAHIADEVQSLLLEHSLLLRKADHFVLFRPLTD